MRDDGRTVTLRQGQRRREVSRFWLRDNCPSLGSREALARSWSVAELDPDLRIVSATISSQAELDVVFSDGMADRFDAAALLDTIVPRPRVAAPWTAGHAMGHHDFGLLGRSGASDPALGALLEDLLHHGAALVVEVPAVGGVEALAARLGPVRETDFGRIFDIITEPDPFTPSQSTDPLDPHTDDPYRYNPAGISVLHCIKPDVGGGHTVVVDGFAVAHDLAEEEPDAFAQLASVPVPFIHRREASVEQGAAVDLRASAPIVSVGADGAVVGIRFHERSMGTLGPEIDADTYYPALAAFARRVRSEQYQWVRHLRAGEALVYDNQRVLHGRTGISGGGTGRHFRLCTIDRDQVHSRLRLLRSRSGADGGADEVLPAGSAAR